MVIEKKTRGRRLLNLEVRCLRRLERNFSCSCGKGHRSHFPKIKRVNALKGSIYLNRVGRSLDRAPLTKLPSDVDEQISCIIDNLRRSKIHHLDVFPWNLCYDRKKRTLSLIDFDRAMIEKENFNYPLMNRDLETYERKFIRKTSKGGDYGKYVRDAIKRSLQKDTWSRFMRRHVENNHR